MKTVSDEREKRNTIGTCTTTGFLSHWSSTLSKVNCEEGRRAPGHQEALSLILSDWKSPPGGHSSRNMCCGATALTCGQERSFGLPFPLWQDFPMKSSQIGSNRMCLYREAKVNRIQHHQISSTTNAKGTYVVKKYKRRKRSTKSNPKTIKKIAILLLLLSHFSLAWLCA